MAEMIIRAGREKSLRRRHPWIFSGAVKEIRGEAAAGETLTVRDAGGRFIASASYSPKSQISGRVWSFDEKETVNAAFFAEKIGQAVELRRKLGVFGPGKACRLIASEGDFLPGVVADFYNGWVVVQILSAGAEFNRAAVIEALSRIEGVRGIFERSDAGVRKLEGLEERIGMVWGEEAPQRIEFEEDGLKFEVNVRKGHKTGFYLDQRTNRAAVRRMAAGKRVLNVFSYTGAFAVAAVKGGAESVVNVDSSREAIMQAERHLELNCIGSDAVENVQSDAFVYLRKLLEDGEKFDMVILDPPKLIDGAASMVRGCRAYKDLARLGFLLLNRGGILVNFSCSGLMEAGLFQKITADGALDAGVAGRIIGQLRQAPDHPVALPVPESFYLKGLVSICN